MSQSNIETIRAVLNRKTKWRGLTNPTQEKMIADVLEVAEAEAPCGVGCAAGVNGEMLLCGFKKGHRGKHAWATLPTFAGGKPVVDDKAVERAARALRHTTLGGSPEGTKALHEHALNVALIAIRTYLGREKG